MTEDMALSQAKAKELVESLLRQRAAQRSVGIKRRLVTVQFSLKDHFKINRHEIFVNPEFIFTGNPVEALDQVLSAVEDFDRRFFEERARKLNEVKSSILKWSAYLERTLSDREYKEFVLSLLSTNGTAPDDALEGTILELEGEYYADRGIHYQP